MFDLNDPRLALLLESESKLRINKARVITFSSPILFQGDNPVLFPKTINVIQGKAGVHKSRLAETICGALLKKPDHEEDLLDFTRSDALPYAVCYVDTERNLSDQFPYSIQQVQLKAGYPITTDPDGFNYISLLSFEREERFDMLNIYLEYLRQKSDRHLIIVLDVITDCVFNFNDSKDSMKLIDMLNQTINRYDVTFLCLIHENPGGSDKARGHLGTEILNKASTVIQIAFEKNAAKHKIDLIKISYLKCRNSRKHTPFFATYCEEAHGLVMMDPQQLPIALDHHNVKISIESVIPLLSDLLEQPVEIGTVYHKLSERLQCEPRTIRRKLNEILSRKIDIPFQGKRCHLKKASKNAQICFSLVDK